MIEVLHANHVRTARAKGLPERQVILKHCLKPALMPVVSYLGPACAAVMTGHPRLMATISTPPASIPAPSEPVPNH